MQPDLGRLLAPAQIRDVVDRYAANVDAGRFEAALELFTDDAEFDLGDGSILRGRAQIRALFVGARDAGADGPRYIRHLISSVQAEVVGAGRAVGSSTYMVINDRGLAHCGRYDDEYRIDDGVWRICRRTATLDGTTAG